MMRSFWLYIFCWTGGILLAQTFTMTGGSSSFYRYTPEASTGLQQIYVVNGFEGIQLSFTTSTQNSLHWFSYTQRAVDRTPLEGEQTGGTTVLTSSLKTNTGYVVQDGDRSYSVWVFDYNASPSRLNSIRVTDRSSPCDGIGLSVDKSAAPLFYYTINGVRKTLDREYVLTYQTLLYNPASKQFESVQKSRSYKGEFNSISIDPPYCDTDFRLKGDQFSLYFNQPSEVKSEEYRAEAVVLHTEALCGDTVLSGDQLGGSAPVTIEFVARGNDPQAVFYKWEYSNDPVFNTLLATYPDQNVRIDFEQSGTYYVRCMVSNRENSCEAWSETYVVPISDSYLRVPNAFSPGSSPGINDVFLPRCKSIIAFEAHIFNKWGVELYRWNNPNEGWDGRHNGKYVLPGPYYYVIQATGADGKQYNLKGDVNVVGGEDELRIGN